MGLAQYAVVEKGDHWGILHDGRVGGDQETKEGAFEAAVTAASLAIRGGHHIQISVSGHEDGTALGTDNPRPAVTDVR